MTDTAVHPRPTFSTFLHSDANAGGDGLSYHQYQRLLRTHKVSLLQERLAKSNVPGYKKPSRGSTATGGGRGGGDGGSVSRQIFQLKSRSPSTTNRGGEEAGKTHSPAVSTEGALDPAATPSDSKEEKETQETSNHSEGVPQMFTRKWLVKSAVSRSRTVSWPTKIVSGRSSRPKTVAGTRDISTMTRGAGSQQREAAETREEGEESGGRKEATSEPTESILEGKSLLPPTTRKRAFTEGALTMEEAISVLPKVSPAPDDSASNRDELAKMFFWSTSTQRGYDEVNWSETMFPPLPPPTSTLEAMPDPVSQRLTFRRYNSAPAGWQRYGCDWDYMQTRIGSYHSNRFQRTNFCSPNKSNKQIPGYMGYIHGGMESDNPLSNFNPKLLVRSLKPRLTKISRRPNIPGYTGQTHWAHTKSVHSTMPLPQPTTTARVHRHIPLEDEPSPFAKTGTFSKLVTTVSPHNPFNKIEY